MASEAITFQHPSPAAAGAARPTFADGPGRPCGSTGAATKLDERGTDTYTPVTVAGDGGCSHDSEDAPPVQDTGSAVIGLEQLLGPHPD